MAAASATASLLLVVLLIASPTLAQRSAEMMVLNDSFQLHFSSMGPEFLVTPDRDDNASSTRTDLTAALQPFRIFCQCVLSWLVPLLVVVGVIGTSICLAGLLRRKSTQPEIQPWFVALSIADIYALVFCLSAFYLSLIRHIFPNHSLQLASALRLPDAPSASFLCCAKNVLIYFGLLLSTWVQVGISVLRVLSTQLPFTWRVHLTRRNSVIALACTVVGCFIITLLLILPICHVQRTLVTVCITRRDNRFFYASLCLRVLLPLLCLVTSSVLIIRSLREFTRTFSKELGGPTCLHNGLAAGARSHTATRSSHQSSMLCSRASNAVLITTLADNSPARKRLIHHRISYILLGMNATFLLCTLPFEVLKLYDAYFRTHFIDQVDPSAAANATVGNSDEDLTARLHETVRWRIADRMLNVLLYVNNATNWIFYFILGKQFRASIGRVMRQPSWLSRAVGRCRRRLASLCPRCLRRHRRHRHRHRHQAHQHVQVFAHRSSHAAGDAQHRCIPIYLPMRRYSHRSAAAQFHSH